MEGIFSVVFVILYNTETVSALKAFVGLSIQGRDGLLGVMVYIYIRNT